MQQPTDWVEKRSSQRRAAEAMVSSLSPSPQQAHTSEALAHELLVHKIELEMQLLELQQTNALLEDARNSYMALYELAPAGYVTLDADGLICDANSWAAGMLGVDRSRFSQLALRNFIPGRDQARWQRFFAHAQQPGPSLPAAIMVTLVPADATPVTVHLACQRITPADASARFLVVLTDLAQIKRTEAEMGS